MRNLPFALLLAAGLLAPALYAAPAHAQYFVPAQAGGYLPDTPREDAQPTPMAWGAPARAPLELGIAAGIGLGGVPLGALDDAYFAPNGAQEFAFVAPLALDLSGWVEFGQVLRVGAHGSALLAATDRESFSYQSGGLLAEVGGGEQLQLWLGGVLGFGGLRTESEDRIGNVWVYDASYFTTRLHAHLEYELSPWTSMRVTPWFEAGWRMSDEYRTPRPFNVVVIPNDNQFSMMSFGLSLSLMLHTN